MYEIKKSCSKGMLRAGVWHPSIMGVVKIDDQPA